MPTYLWYVHKRMDVLMFPNMAAMIGRLVMVELVFNCHCHNKNLLYCYCFTLQHNAVCAGSVYMLKSQVSSGLLQTWANAGDMLITVAIYYVAIDNNSRCRN